MTLQPLKPRPARPGTVAPPPVVGQETDVYFYGDTVEKLGGMFESVDIRQTLRPTFWPTVRLSDNSV